MLLDRLTPHGDVVETGNETMRFPDPRRSHATQMLAAGLHQKEASERPGLSSIGINLDLNSHVPPAMGADAAEPVDAAIRRAVKPRA